MIFSPLGAWKSNFKEHRFFLTGRKYTFFVFTFPNFFRNLFSNSFQSLRQCLFMFYCFSKRVANIFLVFTSSNFSQSFFQILFKEFEWGRKFPMLLLGRHQIFCAVIICLLYRCRSDIFRNRWLYVLRSSLLPFKGSLFVAVVPIKSDALFLVLFPLRLWKNVV